MASDASDRMHKNQLQQFVMKSKIQAPIYHTISEGPSHEPKFRTIITIDGKDYVSSEVHRTRKAAEQYAAKVTLDTLLSKIKDEGPIQDQDLTLCKSILNEYAIKTRLKLPLYTTVRTSSDIRSLFTSTVSFNGKQYVGLPMKSKKTSEQKAAQLVIESILGDSTAATSLWYVICAKKRFYKASNTTGASGPSITSVANDRDDVAGASTNSRCTPTALISGSSSSAALKPAELMIASAPVADGSGLPAVAGQGVNEGTQCLVKHEISASTSSGVLKPELLVIASTSVADGSGLPIVAGQGANVGAQCLVKREISTDADCQVNDADIQAKRARRD